ncbi:PseG/SpsG family protein [Demetria terragena]|uniref:PseG/SpsG family protein n=1 Tax=Demetria terragena TaxID=63959 RepID=UPI0003823A89|nr:hypothetical protein [Demetria terragena]
MQPLAATRVGLRCDAGHGTGVGHAVRLLALAEELAQRGCTIVALGVIDVPWLAAAYADHGIEIHDAPSAPSSLADLAHRLGLDVVVLDGYDLDLDSGESLRAAGIFVVAMVDHDFGSAQFAHLYVDQNLGAKPPDPLPQHSSALAGIEYALFRDSVLARIAATPPRTTEAPLRVLTVFGGTDPFEASGAVVPLLLETERPVSVTAIASDSNVRAALSDLDHGPEQAVHAIPPDPDLARIAANSDLAVSASGSSIWELLCLGVPTAAVCVVDNQAPGYRATVEHGVVAGLGLLDDLRQQPDARRAAVDTLRRLLSDPAQRQTLSQRGQRLVDGRGRQRVVTDIERLLSTTDPRRDA